MNGPSVVLKLKSFLEEVNYLKENGFDTSLIFVSPNTHIVTEEHINKDREKYHGKLGTTAKGIAPCYADKMARTGIRAKEIEELEESGIPAKKLVHVASNAHLITDFHRAEDGKDEEIGTTKKGNGPAYRDKYARKGVRAMHDPRLQPYIISMYHELYENEDYNEIEILFEGAQGFGLDIDWGDYPYVTSSHCTVGSALLNGVPAKAIRDVWGVAKIYETYVGAKSFEGPDEIFDTIRELGQEYVATTHEQAQLL